jgi:pimeloyl-ACP methyl ester carboxylesterase
MFAGMNNIVLVHGAWTDSSGWRAVHDLLRASGYNVSVVQNPLTSFADDVAAARRVLARQKGDTLLVGHSYGGAVITEAGNAANVAGLVYVAAFVPDSGESVKSLLEGEAPAILQSSEDGFLFLNPTLFPQVFAHDLTTRHGAFLAAAQVPPSDAAWATPVSRAAWRSRPSWYVLATEDRVIPPDAQRRMATRANAEVTDVRASHAVYISQPRAVAEAIARASRAAGTGSRNCSVA